MYLSAANGGLILGRLSINGVPGDYQFIRRGILDFAPVRFISWYFERITNGVFDHNYYGIAPSHRFAAILLEETTNDSLYSKLASKSVIMKPNMRRIVKNCVEFEDDTIINNVDMIVCATGYNMEFPFLDQTLFKVSNGQIDLYKHIFHPSIPPTLALIGAVLNTGPMFPINEMQCRYAISVFKVIIYSTDALSYV